MINLNFHTNKLRIFYLLAYATFYYFVQGSVNTWLYTVNKHLILIVTPRIKLKIAYLRHIPFLVISYNITLFIYIYYKKRSIEIEILYTLHNPIRVQYNKTLNKFPYWFLEYKQSTTLNFRADTFRPFSYEFKAILHFGVVRQDLSIIKCQTQHGHSQNHNFLNNLVKTLTISEYDLRNILLYQTNDNVYAHPENCTYCHNLLVGFFFNLSAVKF